MFRETFVSFSFPRPSTTLLCFYIILWMLWYFLVTWSICKLINPKSLAVEATLNFRHFLEPFTTYNVATVMRFSASIAALKFSENYTGVVQSNANAFECALCSFKFSILAKVPSLITFIVAPVSTTIMKECPNTETLTYGLFLCSWWIP